MAELVQVETAQLRLWERARQALAEAKTITEIKAVRDKAEALRAYGRMARDAGLEMDAAELRLRAERRLGAMLVELKATGALVTGRPKKRLAETTVSEGDRFSLAELEISKDESARSQSLAGLAGAQFEAVIDQARARIADRSRVNLDIRGQTKAERRAERERDLGDRQQALPAKKYGVIYADPEWKFDAWSARGMDRAAANYYPVSAIAEIESRPVGDIAADDCALFLWATVPMLPDALGVMKAWGFCYRSHCIWKKDRIGTGYWFRNAHELLLVGTRGDVPAPAPGENWPSVIEAKVSAHSRKPDCFYELIEQYFPTLPKIELNARRERAGWDSWGLEAPANKSDSAAPGIARQQGATENTGSASTNAAVRPTNVVELKSIPIDRLGIPDFLRR